jgi:hypothetical protein
LFNIIGFPQLLWLRTLCLVLNVSDVIDNLLPAVTAVLRRVSRAEVTSATWLFYSCIQLKNERTGWCQE